MTPAWAGSLTPAAEDDSIASYAEEQGYSKQVKGTFGYQPQARSQQQLLGPSPGRLGVGPAADHLDGLGLHRRSQETGVPGHNRGFRGNYLLPSGPLGTTLPADISVQFCTICMAPRFKSYLPTLPAGAALSWGCVSPPHAACRRSAFMGLPHRQLCTHFSPLVLLCLQSQTHLHVATTTLPASRCSHHLLSCCLQTRNHLDPDARRATLAP